MVQKPYYPKGPVASPSDNIKWRKEHIERLDKRCQCLPELVRHMLLFAVEDQIKDATEDNKNYTNLIGKYASIDPYIKVSWERLLDESIVQMATYQALKEELEKYNEPEVFDPETGMSMMCR